MIIILNNSNYTICINIQKHIYIYIHINIYIYTYIYIHMHRERERVHDRSSLGLTRLLLLEKLAMPMNVCQACQALTKRASETCGVRFSFRASSGGYARKFFAKIW